MGDLEAFHVKCLELATEPLREQFIYLQAEGAFHIDSVYGTYWTTCYRIRMFPTQHIYLGDECYTLTIIGRKHGTTVDGKGNQNDTLPGKLLDRTRNQRIFAGLVDQAERTVPWFPVQRPSTQTLFDRRVYAKREVCTTFHDRRRQKLQLGLSVDGRKAPRSAQGG